MKLILALVIPLVLASACKADSTTSAPARTGDESTARSGKIDLPRPRLEHGSGSAGDDPRARMEDAKRRWGDARNQRRDAVDADHDGMISPEERTAARHQRAVDMRARLDTNHDGKVTADELAASRFAHRIADLAAVDANRDGEISVDELESALGSLRGGRRGSGGDAPGSDQP